MAYLSYDTGDSGRRIVLDIDQKIARLKELDTVVMGEAAGVVYEYTRQWFDSNGENTWPKLAEATVAKKASQGAADPERPLYAEGNLYESVTSPSGPHSYLIPMHDGIVIGVSWTAAKALAMGTRNSGRGHNTVIPARPIFPPPYSTAGQAMMKEIGALLFARITGKPFNSVSGGGIMLPPAGPGAAAAVGRSSLGTFISRGPY